MDSLRTSSWKYAVAEVLGHDAKKRNDGSCVSTYRENWSVDKSPGANHCPAEVNWQSVGDAQTNGEMSEQEQRTALLAPAMTRIPREEGEGEDREGEGIEVGGM